ncbi:hypothetical protein E2C01_017013 [Portunus trituberculatus]|uniref:Uncharacterized protein n=1 Tax=Portunus trituberculatus TaxID=210409 RepID=A0A5B7DS90_PORTR|nr:hypothetical protein [Portunus trituberculatus]
MTHAPQWKDANNSTLRGWDVEMRMGMKLGGRWRLFGVFEAVLGTGSGLGRVVVEVILWVLRRPWRETPEGPEIHVMLCLKRGDAANDSIKMRNERDKRRQTPNTALFALNRYVNPRCRAALVASRDHHVRPPRGCLLLTLMPRCCRGAPGGDALAAGVVKRRGRRVEGASLLPAARLTKAEGSFSTPGREIVSIT